MRLRPMTVTAIGFCRFVFVQVTAVRHEIALPHAGGSCPPIVRQDSVSKFGRRPLPILVKDANELQLPSLLLCRLEAMT